MRQVGVSLSVRLSKSLVDEEVLVKKEVDEAWSVKRFVEEDVSCMAIAATLFFSLSLSSSLSSFDCHS
jgi:hypothetical protein